MRVGREGSARDSHHSPGFRCDAGRPGRVALPGGEMMTRSIRVQTSALLMVAACSVAAPLAQQPPATQLRNGQITFTQDGKEVTWLLWQGTLRAVAQPRPV